MLLRAIDQFFKHDAAGGIMLMLSAVIALFVANSGLASSYDFILNTMGAITMNGKGIEKPMLLWINDGLMAVFFFLIGLELKRELLEGKLKNPRDVILPGAAAIGGMALPAAIFAALNWNSPETLSGWAIPAATDIAFALGVLALVGSRVPAALKVFLLTLAILDDLGAIVIIALFYTAELKVDYLFLSLLPLGAMLATTRFPGRGAVIVLVNALMGLPPVVVGLLVYLALSNAGPLGWMRLLYTPAAMIIAQTVLITPIVAALTRDVVEKLDDEYGEYFRSLCVSRGRALGALLWDARFSLLTVGLAGFGRAVAEVGEPLLGRRQNLA